jgi:hypothetical protein
MKRLFSKTIWGGVIAGLSQILPILDLGIFGPKAQAIGTGVGIILGAVGARDAISKNGAGK